MERGGEQWEYRIEKTGMGVFSELLTAEWLNELGADGWELCGAVGQAGNELIFKRSIRRGVAEKPVWGDRPEL